MNEIRVVLFTGGALLEREVVDFLERLEADPAIDVGGVFSQTERTGMSGVLGDLWARRGLLAVPLALQLLVRCGWRWVGTPGHALRQRRLLLDLEDRLFFVDSLHDPRVLETIRTLKQELGLVYGGPIVRRELFSIPEHGTLGIHHGKVPEYRGKKTTFWAMFNGETEVGVIIQQIGDRLDSGDIIEEAIIPIGKKPIMLVKKQLARQGIDRYIEAIHAIQNGSARPRPQEAPTRILYKDPGALEIVRFWGRYLQRLLGTRS